MTEAAFEFLPGAGWSRVGREVFAPDQFKGGFVLRYVKGSRALELRYLDLEFAVHADGDELFGSSIHTGFSGNQFSREHLQEHLPQLARSIESRFRPKDDLR